MEDRPLRVCIFSQNNPKVFSGGRYHALLLAEALALRGHSVHYVTNALPVFFDEMPRYAGHPQIQTHITPNFLLDLTGQKFDAVIATPGRSDAPIYYNAARMTALMTGAQLFLINFESGNWFNSLAPQTRDISDWDHWKRLIEVGGTVLSSAHESERWAKEFYVENPETTRFAVWSPPINSGAADEALDVAGLKEKRAVIISRLSDPHKGMNSILEIIPDEMAGWALTIISGSGDIEESFLDDLRSMAADRGLTLDFVFQPDDRQKFEELLRARILIFPSMFEGYGYPPIEALYCNTEVVAYDLPVVRETCGDHPYYAPHGDRDALREQLAKAIMDPKCGERNLRAHVEELARMDSAAVRIENVMREETLPDNRTTGKGQRSSGIVRSSATAQVLPSVVSSTLTRARNFAARQKNRVLMLGSAEGRQKALSRISHTVAPKAQERRFGVGECSIDELGVVSIRGWRIGGERADGLEAKIGETLLVPGQLNLARPDVHKKYPEYRQSNAGFEVSGRFVDEDLVDLPVELIFSARGEIVDRINTFLKPAKDTSINWVNERRARARDAKGRISTIVADLDDIKVGALTRPNFLSLVAALKAQGSHIVLVLRANPVESAPHEAGLVPLVDEVVMADITKPVRGGERLRRGQLVSKAVRTALKTVQTQRPQSAIIAFGEGLSAILADAQSGAKRIVYVFEPVEDDARIADAEYVINADAPDLATLPDWAPDHTGIHLPLVADALGKITPAPPAATDLVIPSTQWFDGADDAVIALAEACQAAKLPSKIRVLGPVGDRLSQGFTDGEIDLPENVKPTGTVPDPATFYAMAAVTILPFKAATTDNARTLERAALEANAHGRLVLTPDPASAPQNRAGRLRFPDLGALVERVGELLARPAERAHLEKPLHNALLPMTAARASAELHHVLAVSAWPFDRLAASGSDPVIQESVKALLALTTDPSSAEPINLLIDADLSVARAFLNALTASGMTIDGVYSHTPGFDGQTLDSWTIQRPSGPAGTRFLLAMLDTHAILAADYRLRRQGYATSSLLPVVRAADHDALIKLQHCHPDQNAVLMTQQGDTRPTLPRAKKGDVWIATEAFLKSTSSKTVPGKLDYVIISSPRLSATALAELMDAAPKARFIACIPAAGGVNEGVDRLVRIDPETPTWRPVANMKDWALETSGVTDLSLRDGLLLAEWMGCSQVEVRGHDLANRLWSELRTELMDRGMGVIRHTAASKKKAEMA